MFAVKLKASGNIALAEYWDDDLYMIKENGYTYYCYSNEFEILDTDEIPISLSQLKDILCELSPSYFNISISDLMYEIQNKLTR